MNSSAETGGLKRALASLAGGGMAVIRPPHSAALPPFVVAPAEEVEAETVRLLAGLGQGQIYLALSNDRCDRLGLDVQGRSIEAAYRQTEAIDARSGTASGLSAEGRAHTIRLASSPAALAADFVKPGHVLPLRAASGGVLERPRPTEAAVDMVKACGGGEGAVIAPLLEADDDRKDGPVELPEVSIGEVLSYRWQSERLLERTDATALPTADVDFRAIGFREKIGGRVHLAMIAGDLAQRGEVLVSVHEECVLGCNLRGSSCDCAARLQAAIERMRGEAGVLIYSQIPPSERRLNPLSSCRRSREAAGEAPPAESEGGSFVAQILEELNVDTIAWLDGARAINYRL